MATVPALAVISVVAQQADVVDALNHFVRQQSAVNSGFIWLISISVVIMVPTMVIWLVWMWRAWSSAKRTDEVPSWGYEYD
jgi:heme/copper-type cytochrome/quinol oxidase subunit 2